MASVLPFGVICASSPETGSDTPTVFHHWPGWKEWMDGVLPEGLGNHSPKYQKDDGSNSFIQTCAQDSHTMLLLSAPKVYRLVSQLASFQ